MKFFLMLTVFLFSASSFADSIFDCDPQAAACLEKPRSQEIIDKLDIAYSSVNGADRMRAVIDLARLEGHTYNSIMVIVSIMQQDEDSNVRMMAVSTLGRISPMSETGVPDIAVEAIIDEMRLRNSGVGNTNFLIYGIRALAELRPNEQRVIEVIRNLENHTSAYVRSQATRTLEELGL